MCFVLETENNDMFQLHSHSCKKDFESAGFLCGRTVPFIYLDCNHEYHPIEEAVKQYERLGALK